MKNNSKKFYLFNSKSELIQSFDSGQDLAKFLKVDSGRIYYHEKLGRLYHGKYYFSKDENFQAPKIYNKTGATKDTFGRLGDNFGGLF